jgi:DNA repair protein RecO (recombination protein O)
VVGSVDVGEAHKVVRLLTSERGRVAVMARGARASSKRFAGVLDIGTTVDAQLGKGRGGLPVLQAADRVTGPKKSRRDLDRLALLAYGCELCDALAAEDEPAPKLFGLLAHWIGLLEGAATPGTAARIALEAKALSFAGLAPALRHCASCGAALDDPAVFDVEGGGGRHGRCGGGVSGPASTLADFEVLRRTPLADIVGRDDLEPGPFRWSLARMVEAHVGRALRSRGLLVDLEAPRG